MGLFRKKKNNSINPEEFRWLTVEEALSLSKGEKPVNEETIVGILNGISDQRKNVDALNDETKFEYEEIIRHLADLQRLDNLNERELASVTDTARLIVNLEQQRESYMNKDRRISGECYHAMEMYEEEIPKQLKVMEEREKYLMVINNDIRQIEGEKGSIRYEKEYAVSKKKFLTKFALIAMIILVSVFILFFVLSEYSKKSMLLSFLVTGVIASAYAAYYAVAMKKISSTVRKCDILMNRAVELNNKIKIKLVNTTNALDYSYEKYHCNSYRELAYNWKEYVAEKEEETKYRKNSQLLAASQNSLVEILEQYGFEIPDIWVHQAETLINRGELSDLKDVLEARRRKLRAQLDYTMKQREGLASEINMLYVKYPQYGRIIDRFSEGISENTT